MLSVFFSRLSVKEKRGNTLVFVMLAITVLTLLCAALVTLTFQVYKSTKTHGKVDYSYYAAQSAVEMYINKMWIAQNETIKDFKTITPNPGTVNELFRAKLQLELMSPRPSETPTPLPSDAKFVLTTPINPYGVTHTPYVQNVEVTIDNFDISPLDPNAGYKIKVDITAKVPKRNNSVIFSQKEFVIPTKPPTPVPSATSSTTSSASNTPTPTSGNTPTPTSGAIAPWDSNNVFYKIDTKVSYMGYVYKCTFEHWSNNAWTPDTQNTLWEKV